MTLIARIGSALLFLAVVLPLVSAHDGDGGSWNDNRDRYNDKNNDRNNKSCGQNEFLFGWKNICLPIGGRTNRPKPPKGSDCPPTKWYWGDREGCCVPVEPPKPHDPEPQCRGGWKWLVGEHRCCEDDKPPKPPHPHPSGNPKPCTHCEGFDKRSLKSRTVSLCPAGLEACPVARMSTDYECLDTAFELESCGGCVALGKGQDCTAIKGAWNVGCEQGSCKVYTCAAGYKRSEDGKSCLGN